VVEGVILHPVLHGVEVVFGVVKIYTVPR
jgi:hypothetical protein